MKQDLESAIDNVYQEMNFENLVAIISQMITNRVHHSCHYLLSDYSLGNRHFYHHNKLYLPNKDSLHFNVLQESYDQSIAGHPGVAKNYEILQHLYYRPRIVEIVRQYIRNCHVCARAKLAKN